MVINKFCHIFVTDPNIIYLIVFGPWLNIPLEKTAHRSIFNYDFGQQGILSNGILDHWPNTIKINFTGIGSNNMAKCINYQILANQLL